MATGKRKKVDKEAMPVAGAVQKQPVPAKGPPSLPDYNPAALRVPAPGGTALLDAALADLRREAGRDDITNAPGALAQIDERATAKAQADVWSRPEAQAAFLEQQFGQKNSPGMELDRLVQNLEAATRQVNAGDMTGVEAMLLSQASALNTMFTVLAQRAVGLDDQNYLKH